MANNLSSNTSTFTKRFSQVAVPGFEGSRVISKTVDTQWIDGDKGITPQTGSTIYMKRSPLFKAVRTAGGDLTGQLNDLAIGKIAATVQNFISIPIEYSGLEEVTQLDELERIVQPAFEEIASNLELMVADFMLKNAGHTFGTPGTPVTEWEHVAGTDALLTSIGIPETGNRYYVMNHFGKLSIAKAKTELNNEGMVKNAWERAGVAMLGNLDVRASNALSSYQAGATSDRSGTLASTPDGTFATHKDTMVQTLSLTGLDSGTANAIRPGDTLVFPTKYLVNVKNKQVVIGPDGLPVPWSCTVVSGGTTVGGAVTVTVTNAAIAGASGADAQYQNISAALASGDAFTVLGTASASYSPNLAYHKSAIALGTVKLPRLHATDFYLRSHDGLVIRVSKGSDIIKNSQFWRLDLLPVLGVTNPQAIVKAYGTVGSSI